MLENGQWQACAPENAGRTAGFHLSSLYSPVGWRSWIEIARAWESAAMSDSRSASAIKTFKNTELGETWVEEGEAPDWQRLLERREDYRIGSVPADGLLLTAGADVQKDRIEVSVWAFGRGKSAWLIEHRVLMGDTARSEVWSDLAKLLGETWTHSSSCQLSLARLALDTGYRFTAITAGAHKNDYSPHEPLSDSVRTELQGEVDRLYAIFTEHVASARQLDVAAVRATEAGLFFGDNAVAQGLVDGVQTLEATLAEFHQFINTPKNALIRPPSQVRGVIRAEAALPRKDSNMNQDEKVVDPIDADIAAALVAEARREVTQSAQAIAELCLLAGCPERAAEFIAAGKTEADVRRMLVDARAARSEADDIRSTITPDAGSRVRSLTNKAI